MIVGVKECLPDKKKQYPSKRRRRSTHLWWHIEGYGSKINFGVAIDAGNYEKESWTTSSARQETSQSEDHCPFIFLYDLRIQYIMNHRSRETGGKKTNESLEGPVHLPGHKREGGCNLL